MEIINEAQCPPKLYYYSFCFNFLVESFHLQCESMCVRAFMSIRLETTRPALVISDNVSFSSSLLCSSLLHLLFDQWKYNVPGNDNNFVHLKKKIHPVIVT